MIHKNQGTDLMSDDAKHERRDTDVMAGPGDGFQLPNGFRELTEAERNPLTEEKPINAAATGRSKVASATGRSKVASAQGHIRDASHGEVGQAISDTTSGGGTICPKCGQVHKGCTAHSKHRDAEGNLVPCKQVNGLNPHTKKCYKHGGTTPGGMASPHYKHGKRSRYLKDITCPKIAAGYKAALLDPELHSLDAEIALMQSRIGELLRGLGNSDPVAADQLWAEIKDAAAHKARLAATEHKRQVDLHVLVSVCWVDELLLAFVERVNDALNHHLDIDLARRIMGEIARQCEPLLVRPGRAVIDNVAEGGSV